MIHKVTHSVGGKVDKELPSKLKCLEKLERR